MPAVVQSATDAYFSDQDMLAQWLAERCNVVPGVSTLSAILFRDWSYWSETRGESPGTNKAFSASLERRHAKARTNKGMEFLGLSLKP